MVYALLVLIIGGVICAALGSLAAGARRDSGARGVALASAGVALALSLLLEGFGGGTARAVVGNNIAGWIGAPIFLSDALSSGLGAWVLAIGFLGLMKMGLSADERNSPLRLAAGISLVAVLYSLAFTVDLRAFAAQCLLLMLLTWAVAGGARHEWYARQKLPAALGLILLISAVLLVGRTTGVEYNLGDMSLSALTLWPLALILGWVVLWLGLSPMTGWSALTGDDNGALIHGIAIGTPVIALLLRLQGMVTEGSLTGSTPAEWAGAMSALAILGGLTAVVAGAGTLMWAGTPRWSAALTAHWMGLMAWALGLDSPLGRWAALALFAAYSISRLVLEMAGHTEGKPEPSGFAWVTRTLSGMSLAAAPITVGFVGVWLLSVGLIDTGRPALAVLLLGAAILSACGTALHIAQSALEKGSTGSNTNKRYRAMIDIVGWVLAAIVLVGGIAPGIWLPYVEAVAAVAGSGQALDLPWWGITREGSMLPLTMLGAGVLALAVAGRLVRSAATSRNADAGALLPTALDRLQGSSSSRLRTANEATTGPDTEQGVKPAPPAFVWWLSLAWLERGIFEAGALVARLGVGAGRLMERLEGRYFLPLALLLALLTLLAISR